MYYVISFDRRRAVMTGFLATDRSSRALSTRFMWEKENRASGNIGEDITVFGAPDLHTLEIHYARYFGPCQHRIGHCFFCRSMLGWKGDFPVADRVEILSLNAKLHGHCLLCHMAYPVWIENGYQLDLGFKRHLGEGCPVFSTALDQGSVDSL